MMRRWQNLVFAFVLGLPLFAVLAQEPRASVGLKPLTEMTADDRYKGEDGGLYGRGKNTPPEAHAKAAAGHACRSPQCQNALSQPPDRLPVEPHLWWLCPVAPQPRTVCLRIGLCRPLAHPRSDQWRRSAELRRCQGSGHRAASALGSV